MFFLICAIMTLFSLLPCTKPHPRPAVPIRGFLVCTLKLQYLQALAIAKGPLKVLKCCNHCEYFIIDPKVL